MTVACRTCHRVNPPGAAYCYFDGAALDAGPRPAASIPPGSRPFPMPFTFPSGRACRNFNELALACHENGPGARDALREGHLERFLGGLGRLDLAQTARQAARFPDLERGVDQLLGQLPGDALAPAKLLVKAQTVDLGTLKPGSDRRFAVALENGGMRLLYGSVLVEDAPWLTLGLAEAPGGSEKLFQCDGRLLLTVSVLGKHLRAANRPLEGRLTVCSNGGTVTVLVRAQVPVKPFPDGVAKGAVTPRQVAEKAKAAPKEAASLFETGAVAEWYKDNGWTYPVREPSASGLGAVQQFFEALGLVKAPKVTLSTTSLQLEGAPGESLSVTLRAQAEESRPIFAHATTDKRWLAVGRVELKGRTALIPLVVGSVPSEPGELLSAEVTVTANGNQRFVVPVTLAVAGRKAGARHGDVGPAGTGMQVEVLPEPGEVMAVEVLPLPGEAASGGAPPPAAGGAPPWAHLAPLGVFALIFLVLIVRDLFVPAEGSLEPEPFQAPAVETDPVPQILVGYHDGPKHDAIDEFVSRATMRFGLVAHGGNNAANPRQLTFDRYGRSNNTCLRLDRDEILFGDDQKGRWEALATPHWLDESDQAHDGMKSVWSPRRVPVRVTQTVEVVAGEVTQGAKGQLVRYRDTCLVRYVLANDDTAAHTVGLRFLLDTYIGNNDGVPFVIPGEAGLCDTWKDFRGPGAVPGYIEAQEFDDLTNPGTVAHVQFRLGDPIEAPGRVTLGAWPAKKLADIPEGRQALGQDTLWDVPVLPIRTAADLTRGTRSPMGPDSAVVMYWQPRRLGPRERREVGFAYGLGQVSAKGSGDNFALTGDAGAVEGNVFTVQAVVRRPRPGQTLTMTLPTGLTFAEATKATQPVPPVAAGAARENSTITWQVRAGREGVRLLEVRSNGGASQKYPVRVRPAMSVFGRN